MTENKRFINDIDNGKLIDTKGELSTIHYSDSVDFYELWEFLNKLNDENGQLKSTINTLTCDNTKMKKVLNTTKNENEQIKHLIKEAYHNERTELGKSVLKQLLNNIEG